MKKWFFFFVLSLGSLSFAVPMQERTIDPLALSQLALALGIPRDADIVAETQKRWLRQPHQERWEMVELSLDQRLFVLNWATEQGLFAPWKPVCRTYDKALILGATTSRMQLRLNYIKELWNEGTRFREIVWLTGDRPLDALADELTDRCSNESEVAHLLWEEANLPEGMRALPVIFIAVPMKVEGNFLKRPNTEDTIVAWLKAFPEPCKALFVSDQPFCGYQYAVIKAILPPMFLFDVVGQGVEAIAHPAAAAITLDTIARWIYQENVTAQRLHKEK